MTTIVARPSPVKTDLYTAEIPDGMSLSALLGDAPESVRAQIDGEMIPRARWAEPLPADAQVLLTGTPEDDGIGAAVAMIGVSLVAAAFAGPAAAAIGFAKDGLVAAGIGAGITMAGSLAVNALIPPEMPEQKTPSSPNVRNSITGTRNQIDKHGVVPRVYGNPRWYPKLAANPVTEIAGNDQYLRMLLVLGYGPLEIAGNRVGAGHSVLRNASVGDNITIGETNLDEYEDVEWEIGTPDQLSLMTPDIDEESIGVALNSDGEGDDTWHQDDKSATRTTAPGTKEISLDLTLPQGLFSIDGSGGDQNAYIDLRIEYRPTGGQWQTHKSEILSRSTKDALRLNYRWSVPVGQYDVRVTRVRSKYDGSSAGYTDMQWAVLRSVQEGPAYTGNHVLMALRIRATDQLNGVIDQLRIRTQAVLRVWDGSAWVMQATNNPGWAYIDSMTGQQVGNPITDNRLHLEDIADWAAFCDNQGLEYHHVHDGDETVLDRARSIAAGGQGSFAFRDGRFGIVFDDPNTPTVQAITPRNASGFSSSIQYKDLPHAIRVKYVDPNTWSDAERIVYRDGYDESNATRFEDFQLQGVASADEAWHHGNYHLRQAILRPETFSASMDWENLAIVRGNRVLYQYDAILVGLGSARVKSVSGTTIVLDERLEYTEQRAYGISVRGVDDAAGKAKLIATQVTGAEIGETDTFTTVDSVDVAEGDLVIYGVMGKESVDAKVTKVQPNADFGADLTLVNAAPDIYDYSTAPEFDPGITNPIPPDRVRPPIPQITSVRGDETAAQRNQDGSFTTLIRVAYAFNTQVGLPNIQVEARYRIVGRSEWEHAGPFTATGNLTIRDVDEEQDYEVQLRATNGSMASVWSQAATLTVTGQAVQMPTSIEVSRGTFSLTLIPNGLYEGAQFEFYRSSAPLALGDVETSATRLSIGTVLVDTDLQPDTTYYYYVRQWTASRVSEFAVVEAKTRNDPSAIMSAISGEIQQGDLWPKLSDDIDKIPALESDAELDGVLEAIASSVSVVQSAAGGSAYQTEVVNRISENKAFAQRIETLQVTLGNDIASVEQQAQAEIDQQAGRINAMWTLRTDVNGHVAGIGLANDGQEAEFAIRADRFYIAPPGGAGNGVIPFIYDSGQTLIDEALIASLTFGKLTDSSGNFIVDNQGRLKAEYIDIENAVIEWSQLRNVDIQWADVQNINIQWGDIQNVSIKSADIDSAEVDTFHLKGNAVTVAAATFKVQQGGINSGWNYEWRPWMSMNGFNQGGASTFVTAIIPYSGQDLDSSSGVATATVGVLVRVKVDGQVKRTIDVRNTRTNSGSGLSTAEVSGAGTAVLGYQISPQTGSRSIVLEIAPLNATVENCYMQVMGVKR